MDKKYLWGIIVRVALIIAAAVHFAFAVVRSDSFIDPIVPVSLAILVFVGYLLVRYIRLTNITLANMLFSLKERDFVNTVAIGKGHRSDHHLGTALNAVVREFQRMNLEKEAYYRMLEVLNENIQAGILSVDESGSIRTINPAARKIFGVSSMKALNELEKIDKTFYDAILSLRPGEKRVVRFSPDNEWSDLLLQLKEVKLLDRRIRIYLVHNISIELDEKELRAWQQVTEVLTHEIMNSVTPIVSLTTAINKILKNADGSRRDLSTLERERLDDIFNGLETAQTRGKSLIDFVHAYRTFSRTPQLNSERTNLTNLVRNVLELMKPQFNAAGIHTVLKSYPNDIFLELDAILIEQVIINILKNASDALSGQTGEKQISVVITQITDSTSLSITDNGPGMDDETLQRIFVPFFTTKERGTGIGLSLSKQIVRMHQGSIGAQSAPGEGTSVWIKF